MTESPLLSLNCRARPAAPLSTHACFHPACECPCHAAGFQSQARIQAGENRVLARETVREILAEYLETPELVQTQRAIQALQNYERLLKEARRGR